MTGVYRPNEQQIDDVPKPAQARTIMRVVLLIICLVMATPTLAAKSIVGTWGQDAADCKSDPVVIKPRGIDHSYVICYFKTVKRRGSKVRWTGECYVDGARRPEAGSDGVVDAVEKNGRLTIEGLGIAFNDLKRCT